LLEKKKKLFFWFFFRFFFLVVSVGVMTAKFFRYKSEARHQISLEYVFCSKLANIPSQSSKISYVYMLLFYIYNFDPHVDYRQITYSPYLSTSLSVKWGYKRTYLICYFKGCMFIYDKYLKQFQAPICQPMVNICWK
jgi:hypothetical protein